MMTTSIPSSSLRTNAQVGPSPKEADPVVAAVQRIAELEREVQSLRQMPQDELEKVKAHLAELERISLTENQQLIQENAKLRQENAQLQSFIERIRRLTNGTEKSI